MKFEDLSPELKAKAQACKSPEDILALAREEGYELSDEELEGVAGGDLWGYGRDCQQNAPQPNDQNVIIHGGGNST